MKRATAKAQGKKVGLRIPVGDISRGAGWSCARPPGRPRGARDSHGSMLPAPVGGRVNASMKRLQSSGVKMQGKIEVRQSSG